MATNTGKPSVSTMTLLAILSLSLVVNLPGLAVSPMLSTLSDIFPGTTQTEKQLLTVMPNLLIIPFVLLSGKLSLTKHKIATIVAGLVMFVGSAVAYLFARSMGQLIVISCVLGCGAGLIIPFAAGLIADCFKGQERMKVMGFKSGTSNLSLVVATFAVGWLSGTNWHLPFVVYLIGIIPLVCAFKLKAIPKPDLNQPQEPDDPETAQDKADDSRQKPIYHNFYLGRLVQVLAIYAFITFATMVISYYSPFLIDSEHLPDSLTGTVTAIFYLFIFLPGFFLSKIIALIKGYTIVIASLIIFVGLGIFAFFHTPWCMCVGAGLAGLGYGITQPLIYDKASRTVDTPLKSTLALAIVLTANYVAIAVAPFIIDLFRVIFHAGGSVNFPFYVAGALTLIYFIISVIRRKTFGFSISKAFY